MNDISVVVFDLGNVLIPFDYNRILISLDKIENGLGAKFYNKYKNNYHIHRQYEKWELSDNEFLDIMMDWTDHKVDRIEFCKIYSDLFEINEYTVSLLPKLKNKYMLILLSNTNEIHRKYGYGDYKFLNHFEKKFLSHEVGAIKPEQEIYKAVTDYTGELPEKHLFIDDIADYVEGAKSAGWQAIQFIDNIKLEKDLKLLKIID